MSHDSLPPHPHSDLEATIAARAEASGITPATALLLVTGRLAVAPAIEQATPDEVATRATASGITPATAELLLRRS